MTIAMREVRFAYGGGFVLDVPQLSIDPGLTLLLGPNGAGKSTLLRIAAGVQRPDAGTVTIFGHDLWTAEIEARRTLAYVPDEPDLAPYASVGETLRLVAELRRVPRDAAAGALERAGLSTLSHRTGRELSLGQQRRVAFAAAWIGEPRALVLDDPLEALDDAMRQEVLRWIGQASERGATVLVSTHEARAFERWTKSVMRIDDGRVVA